MKRLVLFTIALALVGLVPKAHASSYTYVGYWLVDQGPDGNLNPVAYSGQQAAAVIYGGAAGEYAISTNGTDPSKINFSNWISTYDGACEEDEYPCGTIVSEDFVVSTNGLYELPGDTSAYVRDWAIGEQYANYAFMIPEPGSLLLMGTGMLAIGLALGLRNKRAA